MKLRLLTAGLAAALCLSLAGAAFARNPHCAGGIQYVVQAMNDKQKQNMDDYTREINKAVDQLNQGAVEDPQDFEAMGYLGWAYAEIDSAGPAGMWFEKSIQGLDSKGDKKRVETVAQNRDSYWARFFNDGIKAITEGQDYAAAKDTTNAKLKYQLAVVKLTDAKLLKPASAITIRNLATAYAVQDRFDEAATVLRNGQTEAAADTSVRQIDVALKDVRRNQASRKLEAAADAVSAHKGLHADDLAARAAIDREDAKLYDAPIAIYTDLTKDAPAGAEDLKGLGQGYFARAELRKDAEQRADFKAAGDAYAKAAKLKGDDPDLPFDAAIAYQNCGELALAEAQWQVVLSKKPADAEALAQLGSVLTQEQKYDDAIKILHRAIDANPDEKSVYRQLGGAYTKAGNNAKSTEIIYVFLAMSTGTAASAPSVSGAAADKVKADMHSGPDKVWVWEASGQKLETWIYTKAKQGFTFDRTKNLLVQKSDWSTPVLSGKK